MKSDTKKKIIIVVLILVVILLLVSCTSPIVKEYIVTNNAPNPEIIFTDVLVNGIKDNTIIEDDKTLNFTAILKDKGEKHILEYKISNNSKKLKSKVKVICTKDNDYLKITNEFDATKELEPEETREGILTVTLKKVTFEEKEQKVKCTLEQTEIEK